MAWTIGLHAQATGPRFLPPAFWASERYAGGQSQIPPEGQIILWRTDGLFNQAPRWSINPVSAMRNIMTDDDPPHDVTHVRPAGAPNYSLNYELVRFSGVGYFHNATDVTNSALVQQHTTRIPAVFLVQAGHVSYGRPGDNSMPVDLNPCLQVFTIESRSHVVTEPNRTPDAAFFRQTNLEGLGEARTLVGNDEIANPAKIDIMVERSDPAHPTLLRFSDPTINPANIHGYAHGDFDDDGRDDIALFVRNGNMSELIILSNDEMADNTPLDYVLTRHNVLNYATTTCDHQQLRHVIAADINGDGRDEIYALFDAGCGGTVPSVERFEQNGGTWTRTALNIVDRDGLSFFDDILSMTTVRNNPAGEESVVFLTGNAAAVRAWTPPNPKNHNGIWIGEMTIDGTDVSFEATVTSITDLNLASNFSVGSLVTTDLNGDGIDEVGFFTERRAQNTASSVDFVSLRRIVNGFEQSVLLRLDATVIPRDNIYHTISGNIDYDVRNRTDVAILMQDPNIARHEDRLLVWRSMAPFTENDYAVTRLENGVQTPFFPHGWWGIRLTSGQLNGQGQPLPDINFVDQWSTALWAGQAEVDRISGIQYGPTMGRIPDAEIEHYAEIYNTVFLDRHHHSDGHLFNSVGNVGDEAASTQYFYNVNECVQGLTASAAIADQHGLSVVPIVSHLEHDNYNLNGPTGTERQFAPFDFQQTSLGAGIGNPLPNYFQTVFPVIAQTNAILGTYIADEPTGAIPLNVVSTWGNVFNPVMQPTLTPATLQQNLREFALTTMHRTPGKPVFLNFNFLNDFEFYRNSYDVSLFDVYMYMYDYQTTNLIENGVPVDGVVRTRTRLETDNLTNSIILHNFNAMLRKQLASTIRCDKQAAMVIAQGRGDDYVTTDTRQQNGWRVTLRTYSEYRNLTLDEARYQLFVPAILGLRGAIFWEATSWIQGGSDDPLFLSHEQRTNEWGEVIHHMSRNTVRTQQLRAVIDNASHEFSHYRNIFLQPSLNDQVTVSTLIPAGEVSWTPVVASLHRDPADNTLWLFVGNMSTNEYGVDNPVAISFGHSNMIDAVDLIPAEFWNGGRAVAWASTITDGIRRITTQLAPYQVRVFRIGSPPPPPEWEINVMGHLDYSNQRKIVVWESPELEPNGSHADDPNHEIVRYHAVYHRSTCENCPPPLDGWQVFYRRSEPIRKTDRVNLIPWEDSEECLSCRIEEPGRGMSMVATCAYPSIVVKYDPDPDPNNELPPVPRARVHVVYACEVNNWPEELHPVTGKLGKILMVESVFDANTAVQNFPPGQVYDRIGGPSIHAYGFPVVGAVDGGCLFAHSDPAAGIVGGFKLDNQTQFFDELSLDHVQIDVTTDNHPAIWQYASATSPLELPVVWHALFPTGGGQNRYDVAYARLRRDGLTARFQELAPNNHNLLRYDRNALMISTQHCGDNILASVARIPGREGLPETDVVYWQNSRPLECYNVDPAPANISVVLGRTIQTGLVVPNANVGPNLRLDGLHQIRHTYNKVYDPNVTVGLRMEHDPQTFYRSTISVSTHGELLPLLDKSQQRRISEMFWLREPPSSEYNSNTYMEHQITNRIRTVTRHEDVGNVLQQTAMRHSAEYGDFLTNRALYQTNMQFTPEIEVSRRAYFAPKTESTLSESRTLYEFTNGATVSDIQSFVVDGRDVSLHFDSDGNLFSQPMFVNGRVTISVRGRLSTDTIFDVALVSMSGKEYHVRCAPGEFVSTFNVTGTDSLRLRVRGTKGVNGYHVTELGRRSPTDKRLNPVVVGGAGELLVERTWHTFEKTQNNAVEPAGVVTVEGLSIAPNPSSSRIHVVVNTSKTYAADCESRTVTVQETATGRILQLHHTWVDESTLDMDVQGLVSGSYVITVTCGENVTHGTFTVTF